MKLKDRIFNIFGDNITAELASIKNYYHYSLTEDRPDPIIISAMDGKAFTNGFADRLRGMITNYAFAKANRLGFRIVHEIPFKLEDFYMPNQVDWLLKDKEECFNIRYSNPIYLLDKTKGTRLLHLSTKRQHHIYSNINALNLINLHYGTSYTYNGLFAELFKPSDYLLDSLADYKSYMEAGYISLSFRFMQLMGDLKDVSGNILSTEEQNKLADSCICFIKRLRTENKDVPYMLVTSDSAKFMSKLSSLDYVFSIPGEIGHIGWMSSKAIHLKTFQDFYMISQAKKAFLGYTGEMYKSNFAKEAAKSTGIPFEAIKF